MVFYYLTGVLLIVTFENVLSKKKQAVSQPNTKMLYLIENKLIFCICF